jgi:hypothetical protein
MVSEGRAVGARDGPASALAVLVLGLRLKRPLPAASPERQGVLAVVALQHRRQGQEGAVERGAIIAGEIDEAGLLDETAELDQVTGPLAPLHDPGPRVEPGALGFQAMACGRGSSLGVTGRPQRLAQRS